MVRLQINFCPFCGNQLDEEDEQCVSCNRDMSLLNLEGFSKLLEVRAAHIILKCLRAVKEDHDRSVLAGILKGSASEEIFENELENNPHYGDLGRCSKKDIIIMIDDLIERGFIETVLAGEEIAEIQFSRKGENALIGKDIAWVNLPFEFAAAIEPIFSGKQKYVIGKLRKMRKEIAVASDIPAYKVFDDATLKNIGLKMPMDGKELMEVSGIKVIKTRKYGKNILDTVQQAITHYDEMSGEGAGEVSLKTIGEDSEEVSEEEPEEVSEETKSDLLAESEEGGDGALGDQDDEYTSNIDDIDNITSKEDCNEKSEDEDLVNLEKMDDQIEVTEFSCPECDTIVGEQDIMCPGCGAKFEAEEPEEERMEQTEEEPEDVTNTVSLD